MLTKFQYVLDGVAYHFPKSIFIGPPRRPCYLRDEDADLLVEAAAQHIDLKQPGDQTFSYRDHVIEVSVLSVPAKSQYRGVFSTAKGSPPPSNDPSFRVDFGIFRCEIHGLHTTGFGHEHCRR